MLRERQSGNTIQCSGGLHCVAGDLGMPRLKLMTAAISETDQCIPSSVGQSTSLHMTVQHKCLVAVDRERPEQTLKVRVISSPFCPTGEVKSSNMPHHLHNGGYCLWMQPGEHSVTTSFSDDAHKKEYIKKLNL